jgi:hypothetical protein
MSELPGHFSKDDTQNLDRTQPIHLAGQREVQTASEPGGHPTGYLLLWVLTLISLLVNALLVRQMMLARRTAQQAVDDAIVVIDGLQNQTYSHTVVIDEALKVQADVPVNATIPVTIDQEIPIDTTVNVPVQTPLFGTINLDVPIQTTIPVNLEQDIVIDQTFTIDTAVPLYLEVPIELVVADTPFADTLADIRDRLVETQDSLNEPLIPIPGR